MVHFQQQQSKPNNNDTVYLTICQEANLTKSANCGRIVESVKLTLSDRVRHLLVERRRAIILELDAIEKCLSYSPTTCQLRRWWKQQDNP